MRIVVEIGGGSVACGARTGEEFVHQQSENIDVVEQADFRLMEVTTTLQSKVLFLLKHKVPESQNEVFVDSQHKQGHVAEEGWFFGPAL